LRAVEWSIAMARVVVIGAGTMGLAAAYQAVKEGHAVDVLEGAPEPGGMAAHFDFGGLSIERFYHFVTKEDHATFDLLRELGLGDRVRWGPATMGYYCDGRLHAWGNPVALLKFPGLDPLSKLRYALMASLATRRDSWPDLENLTAREWIVRWCGARTYERLWKPLMALKFHEYEDDVSAAWICARIKRVGRARRGLMQEEAGYIDGGSQTLIDALVAATRAGGGNLHLAQAARRVQVEGGRVTGVATRSGVHPADAVISTVPAPLVSGLAPDLPEPLKARYDSLVNIGVCCLVFKLAQPVTPHLWVNISKPGVAIPGFIEFSNLRPLKPSIVYVPYYMPISNERFGWTDAALLGEAFGYLRLVNPKLRAADLLDARVARLRYAQPVCGPGFAAKLPPVQTPIQGLQVADTSFYYPEDRGIAQSVQLGRAMARAVSRTRVDAPVPLRTDVEHPASLPSAQEGSGWVPPPYDSAAHP
jgi:protoporphyrinogen oxidase